MRQNTARISGLLMFPVVPKEIGDGKIIAEVSLDLIDKADTEHVTVVVEGNTARNLSNYSAGDFIELEAEISVVVDHYLNFNGDKILYTKVNFINGVQF